MKQVITLLLLIISNLTFAQNKYSYYNFNTLTEVKGTDYVLATIENHGKGFSSLGEYLLFINTNNGNSKQIDFPKESNLRKIEQIKLDTLGINIILVEAQTINLNNNKGIDWQDPTQIILLSTDGQMKKQITEYNFFLKSWIVNKLTGGLVITGYFDSNNNNKNDKNDLNQTLVYDLKTMKLIKKF